MFHGSMVAMVTPMRDGGQIDFPTLASLIEYHIRNHTDAIVAVGTTGESATLDFDEHCQVISAVVESVKGRIPVIAGTGANSTSEAIQLTQCAKAAGADAALLVTPYYNKPPQEGLYQHHKLIAETVDIPQILYNVPGRTACDLLPETVARLAVIPNIIGIKEATGDLARLDDIRRLCGKDFKIFSGDDGSSLAFLLRGGDGVISVTNNIAPALMHEMCTAAASGDEARAREINTQLDPVHQALFIEANPIPVKWALHEMGLISPDIRLPLTPLAEPLRPELLAAMQSSGIEIAGVQ